LWLRIEYPDGNVFEGGYHTIALAIRGALDSKEYGLSTRITLSFIDTDGKPECVVFK
jgi:hypothetical protein